jgi:CubicO group peptidase (beta-lactamase class C family)
MQLKEGRAQGPRRRAVLVAPAGLMGLPGLMPCGAARAEKAATPGRDWSVQDAHAAGWSPGRLQEAEAFARGIGSTAVMVVQDGRVIARWGEPARPVRVASIRKSVLSALYRIAVAEGRIDLSATLRDLGIDDKPPALTPAEKQATVRDLLTARSGVYHEAAAETDKIRDLRPPRGSHRPGTHWYYNNWDFNALGTIYRQQTKEDIFEAVERRLARPIGMQDFTAGHGKYMAGRTSIHPAYHMDISARDLARFGLLYLRRGRWEGRQVVPAGWVAESTRPIADARPGLGYGYMWWASKKDLQMRVRVGQGAFSARGYGGQFLFVLPAHDLVVVHLHATHVPDPEVGRLLQKIMAAAPPARRR